MRAAQRVEETGSIHRASSIEAVNREEELGHSFDALGATDCVSKD